MSFIDVCRDKKVLHITDSDLDGVSCRVLSEYYLKPVCDLSIIHTSASNMDEICALNYADYDIVLFTDLGPNRALIERIKETSALYIFDHHQTTKDIIGDMEGYVFDLSMCGTKILYHEIVDSRKFFNPILSDYVYFVNTYDLWDSDNKVFETARRINLLLWNFVRTSRRTVRKKDPSTKLYDSFVELQLNKFEKKNGYFFWPREENIIKTELFFEQQEIKKGERNLDKRKDGKGHKYGFLQAGRKLSFVAHSILDKHKDLKYILIYDTYKPEELKFSLRSRNEEFNVKDIAEKWGGGGHFSACGVSFKDMENGKENFEKLIKGEMHLQ